MSVQPVVQYASLTDVGMRRSANQDDLAVRLCKEYSEWSTMGHLFVVADGMGGHSVGDLASRITVETLPLAFVKSDTEAPSRRLAGAVDAANRAIGDKARENPDFSDMGTTCCALSLSAEGAWIAHVGDSRVYRVRDGVIEQLTFDHSLQWEMIRQGRATAENSELLHPRNVITRCLGPDKNVEIDVEGPFDVRAGDRFLLCSDGLTGHVTDSEMGAVVNLLPAAEASRLLIDLANCRGGSDNTTVVIAVVEEYPAVAIPTIESQAESGARTTDQAAAARRPVWGRVSMALFGLFAILGLILLMTNRQSVGLGLVCGALLLGFVQLIMSTRRRATVEVGESGQSASKASMGVREPAECSPYRRESAELRLEFLDLLSQAQGELTTAATDNGWGLDVEELDRLTQQAVVAREEKSPGGGLREYAKALRILMKEFTSNMRQRG
jgi:serine/threonine protein phosphatase PrpC